MSRPSSLGLSNIAVGLTGASALLLAVLSLRWPIANDLPIMLYEGYLIHDVGRVPYRDFFEMNFPGTMLLYEFLHWITDGNAFACRIAELSALAATVLFTCIALRSHGLRSGILAAACFTIAFLSLGPNASLQREFFCTVLLAASAALVFETDRRGAKRWPVWLCCGSLAGIAAGIKPPTVLLWMPFLLMAAFEQRGSTREDWRCRLVQTGRRTIPFVLGMLLPLALLAGQLAYHGGFSSFVEIAYNYAPLYTKISGDGRVYPPGVLTFLDRYLADTLPRLVVTPFAVVGFLGLIRVPRIKNERLVSQTAAVCALVPCALLYLPIGGKFWLYHQIPLFYAMALCAGLSVSRGRSKESSVAAWPTVILCVAIAASLPLKQLGRELQMWKEGKTHVVRGGAVEAAATYLMNHTEPSATIMPLDVSSGAIHALYLARRPLYGRFIYDFQFYHHTGHPYIRALKDEMIAQLRGGEPDIVLLCDSWRPYGYTCEAFPELEAILRRDYMLVARVGNIAILRRH